MGTMASQITSLTIVYSTVYSGVDQRKHQSSASLACGEFTGDRWIPGQVASNAENVSISWRHHANLEKAWHTGSKTVSFPFDISIGGISLKRFELARIFSTMILEKLFYHI